MKSIPSVIQWFLLQHLEYEKNDWDVHLQKHRVNGDKLQTYIEYKKVYQFDDKVVTHQRIRVFFFLIQT